MSPNIELSTGLQRLHRRWEAITDVPEPPRSTMDVIEYGLGNQQRAEVYLNRLLCYLLNPTQPHRMGTDFLEAFLTGLPTACGFNEDTYDLSDVRVTQQVPVWDTPTGGDPDATPGYLDLLLDIPNEWFLLVELKFSAEETGTEFYADAERFGDRRVADYNSGRYYLYLHQGDRSEASSDQFTNWTWQGFVEDVLDAFLAERTPEYPQRTASQLHDLRDDIHTIAGMTDQSESDQEKVALYLDHIDAITDVTTTFDNEWDAYSERWGSDLQAALIHDDVQRDTPTDDGYPAITINRDDDTERWLFRDTGGDWQHLFKHGWRQRETEPTRLEKRAADKNDLRIGFYHRMQANKHQAVQDHTLNFNFRSMGSNPTEFSDLYKQQFNDRLDDIRNALQSTNATLTGNKLTLINATYPINRTDHGTFFDAYTAALADAFIDLVVNNPELIHELTSAFNNALTEYRNQ
jgi:hypothetical protein